MGDANFSLNAVKAAYKMHKALEKLNEELKEEVLEPVQIGIGIHYGTVVAGYLGSKERLEYTVIGSTVNQASRLCDAARSPPTSHYIQSDCVRSVKKYGKKLWK